MEAAATDVEEAGGSFGEGEGEGECECDGG